MGLFNKIVGAFINLFVFVWDFGLFILNILTPSLKPGHVVPAHATGHNLTWPTYVPPQEGDSRSACPMLNALANHGILPQHALKLPLEKLPKQHAFIDFPISSSDGKNIPFRELNTKVRQTFNFAPSFCFFVPKFSADFLNRSYWSGRFDLADLSLHSDAAIEHDASLTRQDAALVPDQGTPDLKLVEMLLGSATGKMADGSPKLTTPDLSRALANRRRDARKTNKAYTESFFHNTFGSAKYVSSTMLTIFGGSIADLTPMLTEERFPENWEPRVTSRYGLTMAKFNGTVIPVERGVKRELKA
ncbi:sterigmatocystin biosynthesis peroxidase stcC [Hyphodiscus hymeniophilus]|uniref:Sterigmatocystin biosynthesis peroxidase stcC n=1 Tax=Hyphodiscus hymeniophilus TaxID=353542 RepID=A0A9P6VEC3_9HELO|nr:sterigmatocystin biosynthesis peroxidase stcC [Hyphodiscus hymeniophilus]